MNHFPRRISRRLAAGAVAVACIAVTPFTAWAQEKQKVSLPAVAGKYTEQHQMDVGDVPGHVIRISELHRVYDKDAPLIAGTRVKESWNRTLWDYVDLNGSAVVYSTYVLENGDKFFCTGTLTGQNASTSGGKIAIRYLATLHITGGTGKVQGIRGIVRLDGATDPSAPSNQTKGGDIEYWFETRNAPSTSASSASHG